MIEFKLNNKQIRETKVGTYPLRALLKLQEANMETRPLSKRKKKGNFYYPRQMDLLRLHCQTETEVVKWLILQFHDFFQSEQT